MKPGISKKTETGQLQTDKIWDDAKPGILKLGISENWVFQTSMDTKLGISKNWVFQKTGYFRKLGISSHDFPVNSG